MSGFANNAVFKLRKSSTMTMEKDVQVLLVAGEECMYQYHTLMDYFIFTNKRIIAVNVEGISAQKKTYKSLPYNNVLAFDIETQGAFDQDSQMVLYMSGIGKVRLEFYGANDVTTIGRLIGLKTL